MKPLLKCFVACQSKPTPRPTCQQGGSNPAKDGWQRVLDHIVLTNTPTCRRMARSRPSSRCPPPAPPGQGSIPFRRSGKDLDPDDPHHHSHGDQADCPHQQDPVVTITETCSILRAYHRTHPSQTR